MGMSKKQSCREREGYLIEQVAYFRKHLDLLDELIDEVNNGACDVEPGEEQYKKEAKQFKMQAEDLEKQVRDLKQQTGGLEKQVEDLKQKAKLHAKFAKECRTEADLFYQLSDFYTKEFECYREREELALERLEACQEEAARIAAGDDSGDSDDSNESTSESEESDSAAAVADEHEKAVGGIWLTTEFCDHVKKFVWEKCGGLSNVNRQLLPRLDFLGIPITQPSKRRFRNLVTFRLPPVTDPGYPLQIWTGHHHECHTRQFEQLYELYASGMLASIRQLKGRGMTDPPELIDIDLDKFSKAATTVECRCREGSVTVYHPEQARCPDTGKNIIGWVPRD